MPPWATPIPAAKNKEGKASCGAGLEKAADAKANLCCEVVYRENVKQEKEPF